ncbi:MAG: O-antigen ligase family protein [Myxococcaceae bacterium]
MSPRSRRSPQLTALGAEGMLWLLVFFCPLALGSALPWALPPMVIASVLAGLFAAASASKQGEGLSLPLIAAVPALGAALCLAQVMPLPPWLLGVLSPAARDLREFALVPLGLTGWRPVSLDPAATWRELAKHLAYLSVLLSTVQVSRSRRARRRLLAAVALAGTVVSVVGLGHLLFDGKSLFGLYTYQGAPPLLSTFGNANHLAGYLILSGTVALGLALSASERQRALLWAVAYVAMGASALLSLSRGGIVFFVFAQVLFALLLLRRRAMKAAPLGAAGRRPPWLRLSGAAFAGALAVLAVSSYVAFDRILAELESADSVDKLRQSKIELYPSMAEAAWNYSAAGMGRGAFEPGYSKFQTMYPGTTFTHAENVVLQLWSELGLVGGLAMMLLALWAFSRLLRRDALGVKDFAALAAVAALVLHNLFDFNLELAACAVTACVLLGTAARPEEKEKGRGLLGVAGVVAVVALLALIPGRRWPSAAEAELSAKLQEGAPVGEVRELALRLIDRHPADYLLYELVAVEYAAARRGDAREALAFVNRALFLRPVDAEAHRIAARSLARLGRGKQALLEYRLAAESGIGAALDEGLGMAKDLEALRALSAAEPKPLEVLIERLRAKKRPDDARVLLAWALEELGERRDAGGLWLQDGRFRRERKEYEVALESLAQAEKRDPERPAIGLVRAGVLAEQGKREESLALLQSMVLRYPGEVPVAFTLVGQLTAYGKFSQAREALSRIGPFLRTLDQRAQLFVMQGRTFGAEGRHAKALQEYQSAARVQPGVAGHQYLVAQSYEQLGKYPEAVQAVRAGMRIDGGGQATRDWVARLEVKEEKRQQAADQKMLEQRPSPEGEE